MRALAGKKGQQQLTPPPRCFAKLVFLQKRVSVKGRAHAPAETSRLPAVSFPAWPAAALTTSQLVAASSRTAPGGGRSHPRLEPGGPTLVVEQLGILLVGGESSQLSQGRRLRCQWTWVTGRSPPLPTRGKELLNAIGQRGDKELRGRAPAGRQGGHNGVELPSEPESGSAGSSSCVMSPSAPMAAGA